MGGGEKEGREDEGRARGYVRDSRKTGGIVTGILTFEGVSDSCLELGVTGGQRRERR